jgi:4-amino-4-deoxy-L-arabinose transferase-like glycosyltransferase
MRKSLIIITLVTLLFYVPSLGNDFQAHDDTLLITENPTAQGLSIKNIRAAFSTFDPELYIPMTLITHQIEYSLFGLNPFFFHFTNLLLHIGSSILVTLIAYRLSKDRSRYPEIFAIGTGVLFALHPLNTEAVAWAAARKDILSGFFFFASLWAYLKVDSHKKWYVLSILLFALGLLSKISIVVLPVALLLIEDVRGRRAGSLKRTAPFFGLSLIFGIVAMLGKQHQIIKLTNLCGRAALILCTTNTHLLPLFALSFT